MQRNLTLASLLPLIASTVLGCAQGQTGGEINLGEGDDASGDAGRGCVETRSTEVTDDEVTDPISLDELVAQIEGEFETTFSWNQGYRLFGDQVVVHPAAMDTSLSIEIEAIAGTGRFVQRDVRQDETGTEGGIASDDGYLYGGACPDRLEIDAKVRVVSENGALNDEFEATFFTEDGVAARARMPLVPGELEGSFDVDVSGLDNASTLQNQLDLTIAYGVISGKLSGIIQIDQGNAVGAGSMEYGVFPAESPCEYGLSVPADSELSQSVRDLLGAHQSFDFSWSDAEAGADPKELTLSSQLLTLCYQGLEYDGQPSFTAQVTTAASLDDGSIDGTWSLEASIELDDDGNLSAIHARRDNYLGASFPAASFEMDTGIGGIETNADQLSFSFGFQFYVAEDYPASGELTVLSLTIPDCVSQANNPSDEEGSGNDPDSDSGSTDGDSSSGADQGGGSAGCEGITPVEIKNAQFRGE